MKRGGTKRRRIMLKNLDNNANCDSSTASEESTIVRYEFDTWWTVYARRIACHDYVQSLARHSNRFASRFHEDAIYIKRFINCERVGIYVSFS